MNLVQSIVVNINNLTIIYKIYNPPKISEKNFKFSSSISPSNFHICIYIHIHIEVL